MATGCRRRCRVRAGAGVAGGVSDLRPILSPAYAGSLGFVLRSPAEAEASRLGIGERVQKSVIQCIVEPEELDGLVERLRRIIGETGGNVRIYRPCANCLGESLGIGTVKATVDEKNCVIL